MGPSEIDSDRLRNLRRQAEARLQVEDEEARDLTPEEVRKLLHEVRTYQIELEMQNEELRRSQEELLESRDKYSDLYDFAPVGYYTIDEKGVIIEANITGAELLACDRRALMRRGFVTFVAQDSRDDFRMLRELSHRSKDSQRCELHLRRKDDTFFYGEVKSRCVGDAQGDGDQLRIAVMDVTARKQAEQEREELIAELGRKNAELGKFTYSVSHDLKAPLITIRGFMGLLKEDLIADDAAAVKDDVKRTHAALDKMEQLLDGLLELSRVGRCANQPTEVSLSEIAQEAIELVHGQVVQRDASITVCAGLPIVLADPLRLRQLMQNLIENALKFSVDDPRPRVVIETRSEGSELVVCVRDNGIGIESGHLGAIFGPFKKLQRSSQGSGIGLALAKRIVETHGGRIWAESEGIGKGTTICFTLPGIEARQTATATERTPTFSNGN